MTSTMLSSSAEQELSGSDGKAEENEQDLSFPPLDDLEQEVKQVPESAQITPPRPPRGDLGFWHQTSQHYIRAHSCLSSRAA